MSNTYSNFRYQLVEKNIMFKVNIKNKPLKGKEEKVYDSGHNTD